jgi:hypothetical protein
MNDSLRAILERRLVCHPKKRIHKIFVAYCYREQEHKAKVLTALVEKFVAGLPPVEQAALLADFDKMEPEERKKPGKTI